MLKKKYNSSISIFLALVFMVIVSLLLNIVKYVSISSHITTLHMVDSLSVDSAFSAFDRELFEEYGLLFMRSDEAALENNIKGYIMGNLEDNKGLVTLRPEEVCVLKLYKANGNGGELFERQIVDYMKYATAVEIGLSVVNELLGITKDSGISKATDELIKLSDEVSEITGYFYELMTLLDGVKTEDTYIVTEDLKVVGEEYCAKSISLGNDHIALGVHNVDIYTELCNKTIHPIEKLTYLKILLDQCMEISKPEKEIQIENCYRELKIYLYNTDKYLSWALNKLMVIKKSAQLMEERADILKQFLDDNKENINDELREGIIEDINQFRNFCDKEVNGFCDVDTLIEGISRNRAIIAKASFLSQIETGFIDEQDYKRYVSKLDDLITVFNGYRNDDLIIDYSKIDIFGHFSFKSIKSIMEIYNKGILYLVTDAGNVSDKKITNKYATSEKYTAPYELLDGVMRNVTFNEYVLDKFVSYTDKNSSNHLDYEIEYIIAGGTSDAQNLAKVCNELIGIRTIPNMVYLISDREKNLEAETFAATLVGATGIPALVTATKYIILGAWAYGESITDVRSLLNDKKVPLVKTSDTFNLTFKKLLEMDFSTEKDSAYGMKYKDYLRLLLFSGNYGIKNEATMNLIELHMINSGNEEFSMKDMICGADILSKYIYLGDKEYVRSSAYCY